MSEETGLTSPDQRDHHLGASTGSNQIRSKSAIMSLGMSVDDAGHRTGNGGKELKQTFSSPSVGGGGGGGRADKSLEDLLH